MSRILQILVDLPGNLMISGYFYAILAYFTHILVVFRIPIVTIGIGYIAINKVGCGVECSIGVRF